jgi:dipeptidyl aminopeptidase/acylaminoacyl peptidase
VLFNPVVDTTHSANTDLFGNPDRVKEASPTHHVGPGLPPTVIFHGTADTSVPYADVDRFCAEARNRGNQCQLVGYEGATHGFFNPQNAAGKWYRETLLEADRFLTKIGYLPEPVPTQIP